MTYRVHEDAIRAHRRRPCFAAHMTYIQYEALIQGAAGERDVSTRQIWRKATNKGRMGRLVGETGAFFVSGGGERPSEGGKQ